VKRDERGQQDTQGDPATGGSAEDASKTVALGRRAKIYNRGVKTIRRKKTTEEGHGDRRGERQSGERGRTWPDGHTRRGVGLGGGGLNNI